MKRCELCAKRISANKTYCLRCLIGVLEHWKKKVAAEAQAAQTEITSSTE